MSTTNDLSETQAGVHLLRISQLEAQVELDRANIANLKIALASSRRIGAAIGILMATHKITDAHAFDLLRYASQSTNRKLRDIADDVVMTGVLPSRDP